MVCSQAQMIEEYIESALVGEGLFSVNSASAAIAKGLLGDKENIYPTTDAAATAAAAPRTRPLEIRTNAACVRVLTADEVAEVMHYVESAMQYIPEVSAAVDAVRLADRDARWQVATRLRRLLPYMIRFVERKQRERRGGHSEERADSGRYGGYSGDCGGGGGHCGGSGSGGGEGGGGGGGAGRYAHFDRSCGGRSLREQSGSDVRIAGDGRMCGSVGFAARGTFPSGGSRLQGSYAGPYDDSRAVGTIDESWRRYCGGGCGGNGFCNHIDFRQYDARNDCNVPSAASGGRAVACPQHPRAAAASNAMYFPHGGCRGW
jgi:hypothetical protein